MANYPFQIGHPDNYPAGTTSYPRYWVCDTYAGRPVTGLNVGDLMVALDQGVTYIADSTTTWTGKLLATQLRIVSSGAGTGQMYIGEWPGLPAYTAVSFSGDLAKYNIAGSPGADKTIYFNRETGGDIQFAENTAQQIIIKTGGSLILKPNGITYAATVSLPVNSGNLHIVSLTGDLTINASAVGASGQFLTVLLYNDATPRTTTFGTYFRSAGPLVGVASTGSTVSFVSNGANWYEISRSNSLPSTLPSTGALTTASGTYTPTLTNTTNLDGSTAYQCQYMRVGATVTVSGIVGIDPTLAAVATEIGISLPVASNLGAIEDLAGVGCGAVPAYLYADAANNRAALGCTPVGAANQLMIFTFTYQVI